MLPAESLSMNLIKMVTLLQILPTEALLKTLLELLDTVMDKKISEHLISKCNDLETMFYLTKNTIFSNSIDHSKKLTNI